MTVTRIVDASGTISFAGARGGIHYRPAVDDGVVIGTRVTRQQLDHHFHRSTRQNHVCHNR